jgi:catechol 2,3-dioxygenase-like lactoylglutathione lyase family enzyme
MVRWVRGQPFNGGRIVITGVVPQIRSTDIEKTVRFYTEVLGFEVEFNYEDFYVGLRAGTNVIHVKRVDDPDPSIPYVAEGGHLHLYLETSGVVAMAERLAARGIPLVRDVCETEWQTREIVLEDDQGHTLYLGEPL